MSDILAQKLISNAAFNDFLQEQADRLHNQCLTTATEAVYPELLVIEPKSEKGYPVSLISIHTPEFNSDRYEVMFTIGKKVRAEQMQPVAAFFISEAWSKSVPTEQAKNIDRPVSEYADKKEVVFIAGRTLDGRTNIAAMDITREGDKIQLCEARMMPYEEGAGAPRSDLLEMFFAGYIDEAKEQMADNN
jgi:hypothetical protein